MGLFSRKKPQSLPSVPRFPVQQGGNMPSYESEFPNPPEQRDERTLEFPAFHPEPVNIPPPPAAASFPRPQVDDKSQNLFIQTPAPERQQAIPFTRPMDDRLQSQQEPLSRPLDRSLPREQFRVPMPPPQAVQQEAATRPLEIPVREPAFTRKSVQYPDRIAVSTQQAAPWERQEQSRPMMSIPERPLPQPMMPPQPVPQRAPSAYAPAPASQAPTLSIEDKPLFIKIGQYREAMTHMELLKQKIKDAESALAKLEELRTKEQAEISNAHIQLATVKDKLLNIDKKLFEV